MSAQSALSNGSNADVLCASELPKPSTTDQHSACLSFPCCRFGHTCGLEIEVDPYSTAHASWCQPGLQLPAAASAAGDIVSLYQDGHCYSAHLYSARCFFFGWHSKTGNSSNSFLQLKKLRFWLMLKINCDGYARMVASMCYIEKIPRKLLLLLLFFFPLWSHFQITPLNTWTLLYRS